MSNEYLNYNSKKNAHWGKQPRGYYFNEIKSWREDLSTDYNVEILAFDPQTAPPVDCIDHSNPKKVPGSNQNFQYFQEGKDVITLGLERLQGITLAPPQPIIPEPGGNDNPPDEPYIPPEEPWDNPDDPIYNPDDPTYNPDDPGYEDNPWDDPNYYPPIEDWNNQENEP